MDAPYNSAAPLFIHSFSRYTIIREIFNDLGGNVSLANGTWPVANKAYIVPFYLPFQYNVARMFVANGSGAQAGNWDVGVFTPDGAALGRAGGVAQSGASVLQYSSISMFLSPGPYFMVMSASSTSATYFRYNQAFVNAYRLSGILQQTSAYPLPNPLTAAALGGSELLLPLFGITSTASGY